MPNLTEWAFRLVCAEAGVYDRGRQIRDAFMASYRRMPAFVSRFEYPLAIEGKSVLDVGCGFGSGSIFLAEKGAARVVGVDIDPEAVAASRSILATSYGSLSNRVQFLETAALPATARFDVVLSKDSFEHFADPQRMLNWMAGRLNPGGVLCIGFGPLWKSPYGGHTRYMTRFPWAHLVFPKDVIFRQRRRFRPHETVSDWAGEQLNQMTIARFRTIMDASGLRCAAFRTNASDHPLAGLPRLLSCLPLLREYLTFNVYSVWQLLATAADQGSQYMVKKAV